MKKKFPIAVLSAFIVFFSCKKGNGDDNNDIQNVNGFWAGAYSMGATTPPSIKMSALFRSNGTVRVLYGYNGTDTSAAVYRQEGTYTLQNSVLNISYKEGTATILHNATLTAGNSQSGTWGIAPSNTNGGLYSLVKQ